MKNTARLQITLSETAMEKLTKLCTEKGVNRSAIIAMAIDKFFREEAAQNEQKK